jgi:hypothetical protein
VPHESQEIDGVAKADVEYVVFEPTLEVSVESVVGTSEVAVPSSTVSWLMTSILELLLLQEDAANPKATMIATSGEIERFTNSA